MWSRTFSCSLRFMWLCVRGYASRLVRSIQARCSDSLKSLHSASNSASSIIVLFLHLSAPANRGPCVLICSRGMLCYSGIKSIPPLRTDGLSYIRHERRAVAPARQYRRVSAVCAWLILRPCCGAAAMFCGSAPVQLSFLCHTCGGWVRISWQRMLTWHPARMDLSVRAAHPHATLAGVCAL